MGVSHYWRRGYSRSAVMALKSSPLSGNVGAGVFVLFSDVEMALFMYDIFERRGLRRIVLAGCVIVSWLLTADALGCTSAIVSADASASGRPLLWKHRDRRQWIIRWSMCRLERTEGTLMWRFSMRRTAV